MVNYRFTSQAGLVEAVVADVRETFIDVLRARPGYARMSGLDAVLARLDRVFARLAEPEPGLRARALLVLLVKAVGSTGGVKGLMAEHLSLVRTGVEEDIRREGGEMLGVAAHRSGVGEHFLDGLSLQLGAVLGVAGLPHLLLRLGAVPTTRAARRPVQWTASTSHSPPTGLRRRLSRAPGPAVRPVLAGPHHHRSGVEQLRGLICSVALAVFSPAVSGTPTAGDKPHPAARAAFERRGYVGDCGSRFEVTVGVTF